MQRLNVIEDCENNTLLLQDVSTFQNVVFDKAILTIDNLGLRKELSSTSNPTLLDFLNPNINSTVTVLGASSELYSIEYILLQEYNFLNYEIGTNIFNRQNVYQDFLGIDYFYADQLYKIDKELSSQDFLWLDKPFEKIVTKVYKAYKIDKLYIYTCPIVNKLKRMVLEYDDCKDCGTEEIDLITQSNMRLLALQAGDIHTYHKQQLRILEALKLKLNII